MLSPTGQREHWDKLLCHRQIHKPVKEAEDNPPEFHLTHTRPENRLTQRNISRWLFCYHPAQPVFFHSPSITPKPPMLSPAGILVHPGPPNLQPTNRSIDRMFDSSPYPSTPMWLYLHLSPSPVYRNNFKYKPSKKISGNSNKWNRESESQVATMVADGQDAGRALHGDVQQAKYQFCNQTLPYFLPIVPAPPCSNHRAESDTDITPHPTTGSFPCPSPSTHSSPWPEGSTSLISTKASPFPTSHLRSQTPEPSCWSTGCFSTGNKSGKPVKHRQRTMGNKFMHWGVINSSRGLKKPKQLDPDSPFLKMAD